MRSDVVLELDRLSREVAAQTRELRGRSGQAAPGSAASSRTVDDIDADLDAAERERANFEKDRDNLQQKQSRYK